MASSKEDVIIPMSPYVVEDIELDYSFELTYENDHLYSGMFLFDLYWEEIKVWIKDRISSLTPGNEVLKN